MAAEWRHSSAALCHERDLSDGVVALSITMRQDAHSLGRLINVLEVRGGDIHELVWNDPAENADGYAHVSVRVTIVASRQQHLRNALHRLVHVADFRELPGSRTASAMSSPSEWSRVVICAAM